MNGERGTFCGNCGPRRYAPDETVDKTVTAGFEPRRGRYTLVNYCARCGQTTLITTPDRRMQEEYDGPGPAPIETETFDSWNDAAAFISENEATAVRETAEQTLTQELENASFDTTGL